MLPDSPTRLDVAAALADAFVPIEDDWRVRALCAQADPEAWFPEKGESTAQAKLVCSRCDVRTDCLQDALDNDERFGVWGGLSERERRTLRRPVRLGMPAVA